VQRRILELNPSHAVIKQMKERFDKNQEDARIGDFAELLLGQSLLAEGDELPDPTRFGQLLIQLMIQHG
jgi:molecular chaperone HtpG